MVLQPRQARQWRQFRWVCAGALVALILAEASFAAQAGAQAVVQGVPGGNTQLLNGALSRLARDPRDLSALIDAGNAALAMGDVGAAIGFFERADQVSPNNLRVKAGLAGALVRSENPFDAIPLFAEAERSGALDPMLQADRGLAYDLVGDTATAQRFYRQSLAALPSDETARRLALSQAIAGDRTGMEASLAPLLQRQDKAAWRTRAFALAILGKPDEAIAITSQTMPADLASGIAPYLRYMPRLTAAQQAAAANFGRFPRAADIGRDDPRVALYAPPPRAARADAGLVPAGEPLGRKGRRDGQQGRGSQQAAAAPVPPPPARSAPPEPVPTRQVSPAPAAAPSPPRPGGQVASAAASRPAQAAPPPALASASGFNLARVNTAAPVAAPPPPPRPAPVAPPAVAPTKVAPAPAPAPAPARPRRVADAFADFSAPAAASTPAPGAVDVRKIAAAKPKPVEPPKPAHPSRIWVQVGTGRDIKALGFTWRRLVKDNPELFRGKSAWVSDWGRTNRLLAGPFASEAAADAFLARLRKNDVDAFLWTSPAGQVVDDLPGA